MKFKIFLVIGAVISLLSLIRYTYQHWPRYEYKERIEVCERKEEKYNGIILRSSCESPDNTFLAQEINGEMVYYIKEKVRVYPKFNW